MESKWVPGCTQCGKQGKPQEGVEGRRAISFLIKSTFSLCCHAPLNLLPYSEPKQIKPSPELLTEIPERFRQKGNDKETELWEKTHNWIRENPQLFNLYKQYALEAEERFGWFSISLLTERVRWEATTGAGKEKFKISNSYRRYIAILLVGMYPNLEDKIEIQKRGRKC